MENTATNEVVVYLKFRIISMGLVLLEYLLCKHNKYPFSVIFANRTQLGLQHGFFII